MTVNLYIPSTQNFSGKSAICVAFMRRFQKDGYEVGYLKPFSSAARVLADSVVDGLLPGDYHLPTIERLALAASSDPQAAAERGEARHNVSSFQKGLADVVDRLLAQVGVPDAPCQHHEQPSSKTVVVIE